ncbi:MAG: hypothetical protein WDN25_13250 [Acetobacteraceae bacterium]
MIPWHRIAAWLRRCAAANPADPFAPAWLDDAEWCDARAGMAPAQPRVAVQHDLFGWGRA